MHRSHNPQDGTSQDIFHLCSALERFFLYHPLRKTPCIYLLNYLELLFQSARTRICIFSEPPVGFEANPRSVKDLIVLSTLRACGFYEEFLQQFAEKLENDRECLLSEECVTLDGEDGRLYLLLVRIYPETGEVTLKRKHSNESYYRLTALLRQLAENKSHWGLDIQAAMYNCFIGLRNERGWIATHFPCVPGSAELPNVHVLYPEKKASDSAQMKNRVIERLKPLEGWVAEVYERLQDIPLSSAADPAHPSRSLPFANVFFFMRVNVVSEARDCSRGCDDFNLRMVLPTAQRQQLSEYYHHNREDKCQWHHDGGVCTISGMGRCIAKSYWESAEPDMEAVAVAEHYSGLWDVAEQVFPANSSMASAAFRNCGLVFNRRHERVSEDGECRKVEGDDERGRVAACITHRMMPLYDAKKPGRNDSAPQPMYVPLYAGSEPVLLIATVVNTHPSPAKDVCLSEWRRSFRFADYVLEQLSDRLQESLRRIYVNEAVNLFQNHLINSKLFYEENPAESDYQSCLEDQLLDKVQEEFNLLAKSLPFSLILLAKCPQNVIKRQGQSGVFTTAWKAEWQVCLADNPYWRSENSRGSQLEQKTVAKKFQTMMQRIVAFREREIADRHKSLLARYSKGLHPLGVDE